MGSAQFRYQWDRPMCTSGTCINGTGQCASVGHAAMGRANVHQWDRPMCISGTASMGQAHVPQWGRHQWHMHQAYVQQRHHRTFTGGTDTLSQLRERYKFIRGSIH